MFSIYLECSDSERDLLSAELGDRGTLGILELPSGVRAWFEQGAAVDDLVRRYDGEIQQEPDTDDDWVRKTQDSFPAFAIGQRFWLAPPWNQEPTPEGRLRLEISPGMACGTGWHECTQMCLERLERFVTPGCSVLDVGAGSGILSVAAKLLGAGRVVACDIDADAVDACRARLGTNMSFAGTADAAAGGAFDLVVANISPEVIRALEGDLRRTAKPGAAVIVSGFGHYPLDGEPRECERRGEWLCAVL